MDPLKRLENELKNCVKCGACRAHCPVFTAVGREPVSARGKIALARAALSGQLSLDARTRDVMSKCLLCGRCVEKCANDVPTDLIILAAREAVARKRGTTLFHRLVGFFLRNRAFLSGGATLVSLFGPLLFRKVPASSGLRLRFPLPFIGGQRHFPKIAAKPFLARHPEIIPGEPGRPRIVYFVGCMTNFIYPEIGEAAVTLLKSLGCTIIIPKDQQCCGFPALSGGGFGHLSGTCGKESCRTGKPAARLHHDSLCFVWWSIPPNVSTGYWRTLPRPGGAIPCTSRKSS